MTGAAKSYRVAAGASTGASGITGAVIRRAVPAGATAGTSAVAGAAIRRAVATGVLGGAGGITGSGRRIVWTIGTLMGAASVVIFIPTTRIFAPARGDSSLSGDTRVSYVGQDISPEPGDDGRAVRGRPAPARLMDRATPWPTPAWCLWLTAASWLGPDLTLMAIRSPARPWPSPKRSRTLRPAPRAARAWRVWRGPPLRQVEPSPAAATFFTWRS